jgi:hypothetical protein
MQAVKQRQITQGIGSDDSTNGEQYLKVCAMLAYL